MEDIYESHSARLQAARLLLCQVMQLFCARHQPLDAQPEAEALRHWLAGFLSAGGGRAACPEDCLRFHSRPLEEAGGLCSVQEVELYRVQSRGDDNDDVCSRCLESEASSSPDSSGDDDEEEHTATEDTRCFLWLVYQSARLNYKVGLLYCLDSGSWVQFVTHRATDRLLDTRSGAFNRHCPHLALRIYGLLAELKQSLLLTA